MKYIARFLTFRYKNVIVLFNFHVAVLALKAFLISLPRAAPSGGGTAFPIYNKGVFV